MFNHLQDELLDIVNDQDEVVEVMPRSQAYKKQLFSSLRASWLLIRNKDGEFWIPRRAYTKKVLPGFLDGSVVGHVSSGETYEQAMIREAQEELLLDVSNLPYRYLGKVTPQKDGAFCFASVFELVVDSEVETYNVEDICEYFWLTKDEILKKFNRGENIKDSLKVILQTFYS